MAVESRKQISIGNITLDAGYDDASNEVVITVPLPPAHREPLTHIAQQAVFSTGFAWMREHLQQTDSGHWWSVSPPKPREVADLRQLEVRVRLLPGTDANAVIARYEGAMPHAIQSYRSAHDATWQVPGSTHDDMRVEVRVATAEETRALRAQIQPRSLAPVPRPSHTARNVQAMVVEMSGIIREELELYAEGDKLRAETLNMLARVFHQMSSYDDPLHTGAPPPRRRPVAEDEDDAPPLTFKITKVGEKPDYDTFLGKVIGNAYGERKHFPADLLTADPTDPTRDYVRPELKNVVMDPDTRARLQERLLPLAKEIAAHPAMASDRPRMLRVLSTAVGTVTIRPSLDLDFAIGDAMGREGPSMKALR